MGTLSKLLVCKGLSLVLYKSPIPSLFLTYTHVLLNIEAECLPVPLLKILPTFVSIKIYLQHPKIYFIAAKNARSSGAALLCRVNFCSVRGAKCRVRGRSREI